MVCGVGWGGVGVSGGWVAGKTGRDLENVPYFVVGGRFAGGSWGSRGGGYWGLPSPKYILHLVSKMLSKNISR